MCVWQGLSSGQSGSLPQGGVWTKMAKVWGGLSDGMAVESEPGVEEWDVNERLGLCNCVEWVSEVVNV